MCLSYGGLVNGNTEEDAESPMQVLTCLAAGAAAFIALGPLPCLKMRDCPVKQIPSHIRVIDGSKVVVVQYHEVNGSRNGSTLHHCLANGTSSRHLRSRADAITRFDSKQHGLFALLSFCLGGGTFISLEYSSIAASWLIDFLGYYVLQTKSLFKSDGSIADPPCILH